MKKFMVCGFGSMGEVIVKKLLSEGYEVVVVESPGKMVEISTPFSEQMEIIHSVPTAIDERMEYELKRVDGLFLVLSEDKDNLFIALSAKKLNSKLKIVSICNNQLKNRKKLISVGVNGVVSPNFIGGLRMVSEMVRNEATFFLDMLIHHDNRIDVEFFEVKLSHRNTDIIDRRLEDIDIFNRLSISVVAVKKYGKEFYRYSPDSKFILSSGDYIVVYGRRQDIIEFRKSCL